MDMTSLRKLLHQCDARGVWLYGVPQLQVMLQESGPTLKKTLGRAEEAGVIQRVSRGLYCCPGARSLPADPLAHVVSALRPWESNVLSLESALSEAGWLSQIPSRMTVMTSGREGLFETSLGTIEFTHSAREDLADAPDLVWDEVRGIRVAKPQRALRDLRRVGRNLDLVSPPLEESLVTDGSENT